MDDLVKKTCEWVRKNQKLMDRTSYIVTHDPVSTNRVAHDLFVHGGKTYVIDHELADSVFKRTYLAHDPHESGMVVVGITKKAVRIDHGELRVTKRLIELKLEGVVPIRKITYLPGGQKAILYGYCNGGDLKRLMQKRKLTKKEKDFLSRFLIREVGALHRNGILHRDLKLENILLELNSKGKISKAFLSDFGEATLEDDPRSFNNIEHSHCPPEANEAMDLHKEAYRRWQDAQKQKEDGTLDEVAYEEVVEAIDPLTVELKRLSTDKRYDSWALGMTLYGIWNNVVPDDYPWADAVKKVNYETLARKKRNFVDNLSLADMPKWVGNAIAGLMEQNWEQRLQACDVKVGKGEKN